MPESDLIAILKHIDAKFAELREEFAQAFPAEDIAGHRRAHEEWIEAQKQRNKDRREVVLTIIKWGALGIAGTITVALSQYLHVGPK